MDNQALVNIDNRTSFINGDITTSEMAYVAFNLIHMINEDDENDAAIKEYEREPIKIFISSPGGEVNAMWSVIDVMLQSKTPIYTYCLGYVYSAAFKIFLAGSKRFAYKHSEFMYHQLQGKVSGDYNSILNVVDNYAYNQEEIERFILSRTKITEEQIENVRLSRQDWYFNTATAVELGIVTDVIE